MADNLVRRSLQIPVPVTHPTTPASALPVRCGNLVGVALTDEGAGGNAATDTTVDFAPGVWTFTVSAVNNAGASAVAMFDELYYEDALAPTLSKRATGNVLFGYALGTVTAGGVASIPVLKKGV